MTRNRHTTGARSSQGFSLIELMVSLTIGLIIAAAAFSAYLGISGASKMAEAQGRMNEDAQAALSILTQQLRMAGNNPSQSNRIDHLDRTKSSRKNPIYLPAPTYDDGVLPPAPFALSSFTIRGCDGTFGNLTTATDIDHLTCAAGANALPDAIAVSYEADKFNTIPTTLATGSLPTDCLGMKLTTNTATLPTVVAGANTPADVTYAVADNRFYIDTSAAIPSLYCKGNGINSTAQALVENLEDLQFRYGLAKATIEPTKVAGYLYAYEFATDANLAALPNDAARWGKVITVRICIVVRSESPVVSDALSARYIKCDGTLETAPPDLRLRRAYTTTVVLRNPKL